MSYSTQYGRKGYDDTKCTLEGICQTVAIVCNLSVIDANDGGGISVGKEEIVESVIKTLKINKGRVVILYLRSSPEVIDERVQFYAESSDQKIKTDSTPNKSFGVSEH